MALQFTFTGVAVLKANLSKIARRYPTAARSALFEMGGELEAKSVPLAPKDVGTLRGSSFVTKPFGVHSLKVIVGYGGNAADYAGRQHEELDWVHFDGQALYLEEPYDQMRSTFLNDIGKKIGRKVARIILRK